MIRGRRRNRHREPVVTAGEPGAASAPREESDPSKARLGAFSDGVFAFAITLLVLSIRIPHPADADAARGLLQILVGQWREVLAYALSFLLVGINWTNHRLMFTCFTRADHALTWLTLVYLMVAIAFAPIPTAVLGTWLDSTPANQLTATVFYGAYATLGATTFVLTWWYGAYVGDLLHPAVTHAKRRSHSLAWGPAPLVLGLLTLVAFLSPLASVVGFAVVVASYILPIPRFVFWLVRR